LTDIDLTPTTTSTLEELRRVQALMRLEQKEDLAQFKLKNAKASIQERQRRGLVWYPVTITKEDIGFGGKLVLELERPAGQQGLHLFQVGKNASLFGTAPAHSSDQPTLGGVVTSVRRNKLLLTTTKEDLPDWVQDGAKLGIDLTFDEVSYREMDHALGEVMGARGNRLAQLRDVLLGAEEARFAAPNVAPQRDALFYPNPLNDSQLAAVHQAVSMLKRNTIKH
jgi:ATP-dependent RNA/DNA helicase IGHMBP2